MANFLALTRTLIGVLFVLSGFLKLTSPYQNFLYVIESYEFIPQPLDVWIAIGFPWVEFFTGIFLLLGLWTEWALRIAMVMFTGFIILLGQAIIRQVPVTECGCFGEKFSLPIHVMLLLDSVAWMLTAFVLLSVKKLQWGLDQYFSRSR